MDTNTEARHHTRMNPVRSFSRYLPIALLFLRAGSLFANTATDAVPDWWLQKHEAFVAEAKRGEVDVLFLGDSITDFWRDTDPKRGGKSVWDREYAPLHAANFGISADRTQNVLWRLEHGEADGYQPKVVVLLIGTNNTGMERDGKTPRNTTPEVIEGVTAVVSELRVKFPLAKILFLAIFPRGEKDSPQRTQITEINQVLSKLNDGQHVFFLDIGKSFLDANGNIPREIMPDLLHPSLKGYEIWADAVREPLKTLLK